MARTPKEWIGKSDDAKIPPRVKDLAGQRFGMLTVTTFAGRIKNGGGLVAAWQCVCDCGGSRVAAGVELTRQRIISCGCANPNKKLNLAGRRFGKWLVLREAACASWICRCDCGTERTVKRCHLTGGRSRSCGCQRPRKSKTAHDHPLYRTFCNIIQRCENPNSAQYQDYGGRGIRVCPEWRHDFWQFVQDMGEKPTSRHTIERRDNSRGYEPDNCIWADRHAQARNTRRNRIVTYDGRRMPLVEACELSGVNYSTAKWRLRNGMPDSEAFR